MPTTKLPFNKRFGVDGKDVDQDFPSAARNSFFCLLDELFLENSLKPLRDIERELLRTAGLPKASTTYNYYSEEFRDVLEEPIHQIVWWRLFSFIERVYAKLLTASTEYDEFSGEMVEANSCEKVRSYFAEEINQIMMENDMAYQFTDGSFQRRGRAQTQKSTQRVGVVLASSELTSVRKHFNKALAFFNQIPEPDIENCLKESVCALENCLEVLTGTPLGKEGFPRRIKQIPEIPGIIAESMIKIYAYRGAAPGVAHGTSNGSKVSILEAELVLSLIASYITYLVDSLSKPEEDVPF